MHHQTVEFDGLKPIFPKCIPKSRENRDLHAKVIFGFLLLGVGYIFSPKLSLISIIHYYIGFIIAELCSRICCLREEFEHLESRYDRNIWKLLQRTFSFNQRTIFVSTVAIFSVILINDNTFTCRSSEAYTSLSLSFIGIKLITDILRIDESKTSIIKINDKFSALSYGSAMAFSLQYGYLNFMLQSDGGNRKSLKEQIIDYADKKGGLKFASNKLFILIPLSTKCPHNIEECSPQRILERSGNLEWIEKDSAGIKDRKYHHTVYKLWFDKNRKKPVYICAVYVLRSFYQVMQQNHEETKIYKEYQEEIVVNFFNTLQKIIYSKGYNNLCELILFKDTDENGRNLYEDRLDIGDLLLRKINNPSNIPRHSL